MNELYHHGIKGQKWGVQNGPPYPLVEPKVKRSKSDGKSNSKVKRSKSDGKSEAHVSRNNKTVKIKLSESDKAIARAYRKHSGLSKVDAERMALYQSRAKKIAIGVAVGALVAGTAYLVIKSQQNPYNDFTILPGTKIQRITPFGDNVVREQFYGAINKQDKNRYVFGMADWKNTNLYNQELVPSKPIKVAGINTCEKLFNDMKRNDPEFGNSMARSFGPFDWKNVDYRYFNRRMIDKHRYSEGNAFQLFQNSLKEKGYGALIDHNDAVGGGWGTERPVIFFGQQNNLRSSIKELSNETIDNARRNYEAISIGKDFVESNMNGIAAAGGLSAFTTGLFYATGATTNREIIKEYKKLHPNTQLSDSKILEIFDKS